MFAIESFPFIIPSKELPSCFSLLVSGVRTTNYLNERDIVRRRTDFGRVGFSISKGPLFYGCKKLPKFLISLQTGTHREK